MIKQKNIVLCIVQLWLDLLYYPGDDGSWMFFFSKSFVDVRKPVTFFSFDSFVYKRKWIRTTVSYDGQIADKIYRA